MSDELIKIIELWKLNKNTNSPFFDSNSKPIKEIIDIGKKLNNIGGYYTMLKACNSIPNEYRRELDHAWSGIGSWMC